MKISACIVTSMKVDLTTAISSLLMQFEEILIVGHTVASEVEFSSFRHWEAPYYNGKIKLLYCDKPQQSYKRLMASRSTASDVIFFIDDDATADAKAYREINSVFSNHRIGIVTGPSLLPANASVWRRTAQMAIANNPKSGPRYARHAFAEDVSSDRVIGCNMAVRRIAFTDFNPDLLPSYGEEWALAEHVQAQGYRIAYNPSQIVYHAPHGFIAHSRQVYRWGKTSRITENGDIDISTLLYPAVQAWFGLLWGLGRFTARRSRRRARANSTPSADAPSSPGITNQLHSAVNGPASSRR